MLYDSSGASMMVFTPSAIADTRPTDVALSVAVYPTLNEFASTALSDNIGFTAVCLSSDPATLATASAAPLEAARTQASPNPGLMAMTCLLIL